MKLTYSLNCYGNGPFPKFMDCYKTLTLARATARQALKDGYHRVEIMRDLPRKPGYFGIERETVETIEL